MKKEVLIKTLLSFLNTAVSQFHVAEELIKMLKTAGFTELKEDNEWHFKKPNKYYTVRDNSSVIAIKFEARNLAEKGFKIVAAHTDSPALKIKPNPEINSSGYLTLRTESYGGLKAATWFDRDLSIAGKITGLDQRGELKYQLLDFKSPIAFIPNIAVHLTSNSSKDSSINCQKELLPLLMTAGPKQKKSFKEIILSTINSQLKKGKLKEIIDFELFLYDTQPAGLTGYKQEFVSGRGLDNLVSCYSGLQALLDSGDDNNTILICSNHEEIGSQTDIGAAGPFLENILKRICPDQETYFRCLANSALLSCDSAHGVNPNYPEVYDSNHCPLINAGPVIKTSASQRYISNSQVKANIQMLGRKLKIPIQYYVNNSNIRGGSTIGPINAARLGIKSLDIGIATLAMHSIREVCGVEDIYYLYKLIKGFYQG